jgi:hypothetical protein
MPSFLAALSAETLLVHMLFCEMVRIENPVFHLNTRRNEMVNAGDGKYRRGRIKEMAKPQPDAAIQMGITNFNSLTPSGLECMHTHHNMPRDEINE